MGLATAGRIDVVRRESLVGLYAGVAVGSVTVDITDSGAKIVRVTRHLIHGQDV